MTVGFIVLAHSSPSTLSELLRELEPYPVFLHIDRPALNQGYLHDANVRKNVNVKINPDSQCLHWGGYSIVKTMMETLQFALEKTPTSVEHFAFLSGQCFPLRPVQEFTDFLESTDTPVLCRAFKLEENGYESSAMDISRISQRHWLDGAVGHTKKVMPLMGSGTRRILSASTRFLKVRVPNGIHACGSQWVSVPRQLAHELVQAYRTGRFAYLRQAYAPDEMAIPTYVYNTHWSDMTPRRALEYTGGKDVKVSHIPNFHWVRPDMDGFVTRDDLNRALLSNQYFIRKMLSSDQENAFETIRKTW